MTSEAVRQAAAAPDLNHRDPEYLALVREVRARLVSVYQGTATGWRPHLIGGSGTAAVEAMITSCVGSGPVLVVENGYYSARIREILEVHRIPYRPLSFEWEQPINVGLIAKKLREERFEALVMTHDETTLGRLNPVAEVAAVCVSEGVRVLVDAMSSFGADELELHGVHAVAASANKCLHGLPGVGFVLVADALSEAMSAFPRRIYYLHLPMLAGENPPLTPPVPAMQALRQALRENPGGQKQRAASYREKAALLRRELAGRGFEFAVPHGESSLAVLSPTLPPGWSYDRWFEANYAAGFVLYGTKAHLRERFFQVSVMGETTVEHLTQWLEVVDRLLDRRA